MLASCELQRAAGSDRQELEGSAVFSRNNNLSLSNKRGRRGRGPALRTRTNKCWRNKILLPNNIRGRSLLLLNSAALCSVTIPGKLWPSAPSLPPSLFEPCSPGFAHRRESLLHRPSSANFRLRFLFFNVVCIRILSSAEFLPLCLMISARATEVETFETNKGRKRIGEG